MRLWRLFTSRSPFVLRALGAGAACAALAMGPRPVRAQDAPQAARAQTGAEKAHQMLAQIRSVEIPRVSRAPKFEDFIDGTPREAELTITDFRQIDPGDGDPVSQPTTAYLSYDDKNIYAAFVCKDDPSKIRASIARRDSIFSDDRVDISLDTFDDNHRNYWFESNPYGVQIDGVNTDGADDINFDTLWYSEGRIVQDGYVVLITIPFKSLRFPNVPEQKWGVMLSRAIQRNNEWANWPYVTWRLMPSWAGQFGDLTGIRDISPARNMQFIPYVGFSRSRNRDTDLLGPTGYGTGYGDDNDFRAGLDAKFVLRDSLTLDMTVNPDFSQVESDEPQVTVNQRYEVYFPEKRPFFMENADYFSTPENLFFSRRVADPQFGARLTGKIGRWGVAALVGDDRAQGKAMPEDSEHYEDRAVVGVFRLYRELGKESRAGALFTSRDFGDSSNRVFSLDTRLKLTPNTTLTGQWMRSWSERLDGTSRSGGGAYVKLSQSGRHFNASAYYRDIAPEFETDLGFITRVDVRETGGNVGYSWRPEKSVVLSYGPSVSGSFIYDYGGTLTDWNFTPSFSVSLPRYTTLTYSHAEIFERFEGIDFRMRGDSISLSSEWQKWLRLSGGLDKGTAVNYYPAYGMSPTRANSTATSFAMTLLPVPQLQIDETYLYTRLATEGGGSRPIFNNHIWRTKVNYQFTREFSLRAIVDYYATLPNEKLFLSSDRQKQLGLDFLFTYMLHPGTALYVGYTDNYENLRYDPSKSPLVQRGSFPDTSVGRQVFVKFSYLLRI
ncbi:MAG: carbohydrate binding family 9 domain-containing protein [Acidobacteriota bacterium]|jgi:hypothetical protein|nr:carbohydrate binding family 9 domain-containing protein [Acidobacteriota bacterium]